MDAHKEEYYSLGNIADFIRSFWRYALRKWWVLLLSMAVGIGLALLYYFIQKPKYEAVSTFILEEKSSGGGLAGLASQFGFDLGSLTSGGSLFTGDNILDILKSKKIVHKVLLSGVDDAALGKKKMADLFLEFSNWKKKWSEDDELKNISYEQYSPGSALSPKQDSVLNLIYEHLLKKSLAAERLNKKGSIIKVSLTASNNLFAGLMTDRLVDEASKLYLDIKTGTAQANIDRLQHRADSLWALLNRKSYVAASSQLLDINPGLKTAAVPLEIASRDKTVIGTVYAEVTKNLEASKMILSQQTPVIQVLDKPSWPLVDKRKTLPLLLIVGVLAGGLLFVMIVGVKFIIRYSSNTSRQVMNDPA